MYLIDLKKWNSVFKRCISGCLAFVMLLGMVLHIPYVHAAEDPAEGTAEPLAGKTISILGASISTYAGTSNGAAADTTNSTIRSNAKYYPHSVVTDVKLNDTWWMQVCKDLGLRLLVNNSWSGSSLLYERNGTKGAYVDRCVQLHDDTGDNAGETPDIIGIQMGTNDFQYYKDTLGTADIDYETLITKNTDGTYTYAAPVTSLEAAAIVLHKISVRYPDAEVYYLNISQRVDGTDELIRSFNAELKQVVEHFGAHIVDIYGSAITMEAFDTYIGDGRVHPNCLGMDAYAEAFKRTLIANTAYTVDTHTVTLDLDGVTANYGDDKIVVSGDAFTVDLTASDDLQVTVTMGGKNITDTAYADGTVIIDAVTDDVTITAKSVYTPKDYRWEFDGTDLVCVSGENALTKNAGTTADGVFSKTRYALGTSVRLLHDQPWIVEWKCEGTFQNTNGSSGARVFTSTDVNAEYNARYIFKSNTNGILAMGEKTTTGSHNYGLALADYGIDWTALHTYRLENRIAADGSNMVWLYVDGKEIGPLNHYYVGTTDKNSTSDWLSGKDFVFPYMGTDTHGFTNASIDYIAVWEGEHTHFYVAAVTPPGCTKQGYTTYSCACGDSYVDDYVDATGHTFENGICCICKYESFTELVITEFVNGTYASNSLTFYPNTRLRHAPISVKAGDQCSFSLPDGWSGYICLAYRDQNWDYTPKAWVQEYSYTFPCDTDAFVVMRKDDNSVISPEEYAGEIIFTRKEANPDGNTQLQGYYQKEIDKTIESVKALIGDEPCLVFPMVSDIHYLESVEVPYSFDYSIANMKELSKAIDFDFIACLGDITEGDTTQEITSAKTAHIINGFAQLGVPYYQVIGNHDDNRYGDATFTHEQLYENYLSTVADVVFDTSSMHKTNYYKDFNDLGIRCIFLNANTNGAYGYSEETCDWFEEAIKTENGLIVFTHIPPVPAQNYGAKYGTDIGSTRIREACANAENFLIMFSGHNHYDSVFTEPFLSFTMNCQKFENENGDPDLWTEGAVKPQRVAGTESEDCFDIVVVRPESGRIDLIRFGAGEDRSLFIESLHTHAYTSAVTAPTCEEKGYTTYTCACGDSYTESYVDATGHRYENCVCTFCGQTESQQLVDGYEMVASIQSGDSRLVDAHNTVSPLILQDLTLFENCYISAVNLFVTGTVVDNDSTNANDPQIDDDTVYTFDLVVLDASSVKAGQHYTVKRTYTLSVPGSDIERNAWNTFDVSHLDITVKAGETLGFGSENSTLEIFYLNKCVTSKLCYFGHKTTTGNTTLSLRTGFNLPVGVEGYKIKCDHEYAPTVTAPTCTKLGYTTHTCVHCGDSYKDTFTDAVGHSWEEGVCTACGAEKKPYQRLTYFTVGVVGENGKVYADNAVLYLPANYTPDGEPVKLVIYCKQGASQITTSSNPIEDVGFYNYLISLGYAVLGVDGVPDAWRDELGLGERAVGNPMAVQGTQRAYNYVVDNYNIASDGCFISGYSQGGHYAQNVIDLTDIPILAAAEQSPVCSMRYHQWDLNANQTVGGVKFTKAARLNVARIYGFPEFTTNTELLNLAYDASLVDAYDPWVRNAGNVYTGFVQKSNLWYLPEGISLDDITMKKIVKCPVKIWCAEDDTAISADVMKVFVKAIQNAGGTAEISVTSSGGHGFFQSQTPVGTFTENGKTFSTLPIAVEIAQWFQQYGGYECEHNYSGTICTICGEKAENYSGKVISILGGSNCTFAGYIPVADGFNLAHRARYPQDNLLTDVNETWWMQALAALDAELGINDSWAGSQVLNTLDSNSGDLGPDAAMASLTRIQNLGSNGTPDVILFFGGCNDMGRGVTLGSFDPSSAPDRADLTATKWDSFADAYVAAILRMKHFYPDTQILVMLPYNSPSYFTAAKVETYGAVIKEICDHYGVTYVDLRECGITSANLPDGIHPNSEGCDYITEAVLNALLSNVDVEAGETVVHAVTHELTNATASLSYYKGISTGKPFEEVLTGEGLAVTVTMGGQDITATSYADGKISIPSVTGDLAITVKGIFDADGRLEQLPENVCSGTNIWTALEPVNEYYTASGWGNNANNIYSVTFPVIPGERIWATSFGTQTVNQLSGNGTRITWFDENGVLESVARDVVYSEFTANGYITVPEGATAVNIPMRTNADTWEIFLLDREHCYVSTVTAPTCTKAGYTTHTCTLCKDIFVDSHVDAAGHTPGEAVKENETSNGTFDEVVYCSSCGEELSRDTVKSHTPGDITGDGEVNNKDLTRLFKYLTGYDVQVNEAALDVNGDGSVNNKDQTRLFRYLSGYDVDIF